MAAKRYFQLRDFHRALNADVMKKSSGNPPWVKDYCGQLEDPEYLQLTLAERGLLKDLRLLAARRGNRLPDDERVLVLQLRYPTRTRLVPKLSKLRALRFLEPYKPANDSPANEHIQSRDNLDSLATLSSTEERRTTPLPPTEERARKTTHTAKPECPHCGARQRSQGELDDHIRYVHFDKTAAA